MEKSMTPHTQQVPSLGRIVHYVERDGTHLAAIITKVWNEQPLGTVNLAVFTSGFGYEKLDTRTSVSGTDTPEPGYWHWPEYVAPV